MKKDIFPEHINIPLLDDKGRAEVGTLYKNKGRETAFLRALELTGPKMAEFVVKIKKSVDENHNRNLLVHCWRGGMRSAGMSWLFNMAGYKAITLEKGYKAYRNLVLSNFEKISQMFVLGGYTGSGKTEILKHISRHFQTSDLEKFAHHKGSAFGFIGETEQPSTEQFENDLAEEWIILIPKNRYGSKMKAGPSAKYICLIICILRSETRRCSLSMSRRK